MPSFRLWLIFYVFALLAAALATFGPLGMAAAAAVLSFWCWVFSGKRPFNKLVELLVIFCIVLVLIALLLPAVSSSRQVARRTSCMGHLKRIQLAILNYESAKGTLPPAYIADANGKPMHSWRVLLLPYLGETALTALYTRYNFNEPWDGPNNSKLARLISDVYRCPGQPERNATSPTETQYFAVVGDQAAWSNEAARAIREFTDGLSTTIAVIEASGLSVNWMEPRDVSLDEAIELLTTKPRSGHAHYDDGFLTTTYHETSYRFVAYCDGHVTLMGQLKDADAAKALLTCDGGEEADLDQRENYIEPKTTTVVKWGKVWSLSVFGILSLLPAARLGRRARKRDEPSSGEQAVGGG